MGTQLYGPTLLTKTPRFSIGLLKLGPSVKIIPYHLAKLRLAPPMSSHSQFNPSVRAVRMHSSIMYWTTHLFDSHYGWRDILGER